MSLSIGDFNEDGLPDIAVAAVAGGVAILLATTPGQFSGPSTIQLVDSVVVRSGDFDGDGHMDIVVGRQIPTNSITFLWGSGKGTFAEQTSISNMVSSSVSYLAIGDIDGDGKLDVVAASASTGSPPVWVLKNAGGRTFMSSSTPGVPGQGGPIALGDFDGNGQLDIVTGLAPGSTQSAASNVFLSDGAGGFAKPVSTTPVPCPGASQVPNCSVDGVATGNLNGDAFIDIVLAMAGQVEVGVVTELSSGTKGIFALPQAYDVGKNLGFPTVADVNSDGFQDVVVPGLPSDSVTVLLGDGTGKLLPTPSLSVSPLGRSPIEVSVADLNGDGERDIAVANNLTGNVSLLLSAP